MMHPISTLVCKTELVHDAAVQVWGMVLWYNVHNKKRAERRLHTVL